MAYKNVQHYRHTVHQYLDAIWGVSSQKKTSRTAMYKWLAVQLNISEEDAHVKYFTRNQCKNAIKILRPRYMQLYGRDIRWDEQTYKTKVKKSINKEVEQMEDKDLSKENNTKDLVSVTKHIDFEAAHVLPEGYNGKCRNLHGHTYQAFVTVTGPRNDKEFGMVLDFKKLKEAMNEVLPDHKFLCYVGDQKNLDYKQVAEKYDNKVMLFEEPTTAEYMVTVFPGLIEDYMYNELNVSKDIQITKMVLYETRDSYAEYNKPYVSKIEV